MIKNIIASHKRARDVTTTRYVSDCIICIPKSQEAEYKEFNPNTEIVAHPDEIIGLSPKRQWIYEKFGDIFCLDDDITRVDRVYIPIHHKKPQLKPEEVTKWIQDTYEICKYLNIKLFGFSKTANRTAYSGTKPIEFNTYVTGGAFGILKSKELYFPNYPTFVGEDYWITALNAHFYRKSYIDQRIAFLFKDTEGNIGGCADYRTDEKRKETFIYLRKKFGDAIQRKVDTTLKKASSQYEKTLKIPY